MKRVAAAAAMFVSICALGACTIPEPAEPTLSMTDYINVASKEPSNSLIPSQVDESTQVKLAQLLFSGLMYFDTNGETKKDIASAILVNPDCSEYDIEINKNLTFSDGTPLRAANFARAWNDAAKASNKRASAYLFRPIAGFSAIKDSELSGIEIINEYRFKVHLSQPTCEFMTRLATLPFAPLPDAAFDKDGNVTENFGLNPFGYGPYQLAHDGAWERGTQVILVNNERYQGERRPKNNGLVFKFYTDTDRAYDDLLAGKIDIDDDLPMAAYKTYKDNLEGRAAKKASARLVMLALPVSNHFAPTTPEGTLRRQAISMSLNRQEITQTFFAGIRFPATDFTTPAAPGHVQVMNGADVLQYNPTRAKQLWAQANDISPWEDDAVLRIAVPQLGQTAWMDAVVSSLSSTLGIKVETAKVAGQTPPTSTAGSVMDWQGLYPSPTAYLEPLFASWGSANKFGYASPAFDGCLSNTYRNALGENFNQELNKCQAILAQDLPVVPLWYASVMTGWTEKIPEMRLNWRGIPQYWKVSKFKG